MINKHLTYEEWFNEYKDYEDAYKNYVKLQSENDDLKYENQQLKKQKEELKDILKIKIARYRNEEDYYLTIEDFEDLLRMLGEIE